MSKKEDRRKAAEELVQKINEKVDQYEGIEGMSHDYYKVVEKPLMRRAKESFRRMCYAGVGLILLITVGAYMSVPDKGVGSVLIGVGVLAGVAVAVLSLVAWVYHMIRYLCSSDDAEEIGYTEKEIQELESVYERIVSAITRYQLRRDEEAELIASFKTLTRYIIDELKGEAKLDMLRFTIKASAPGMKSMYGDISQNFYWTLVDEMRESRERLKLVEEIEARVPARAAEAET